MNIKYNQKIRSVSWLSSLNGKGHISTLYEPVTIQELEELCTTLFAQNLTFDLIGHTSNTLYEPDYVCERMVSTRKLNRFEINENGIICECGTSVRALSLAAIEAGIKGFEGLIDLPGTVGAAVYGNAGCYGCSISSLLKEAVILNSNGHKENVTSEWFGYNKRSSVLKRGEERAVILKVVLRRENGDINRIKEQANLNHTKRKHTQPESKNSLGSIFANSGGPTKLNRLLTIVTTPYALILKFAGYKEQTIREKRKKIIFALLGASDVEPYVHTWNWYQWRDEQSYVLFWKFVKLHQRMFTRSDFEIEIKHNRNFIIP